MVLVSLLAALFASAGHGADRDPCQQQALPSRAFSQFVTLGGEVLSLVPPGEQSVGHETSPSIEANLRAVPRPSGQVPIVHITAQYPSGTERPEDDVDQSIFYPVFVGGDPARGILSLATHKHQLNGFYGPEANGSIAALQKDWVSLASSSGVDTVRVRAGAGGFSAQGGQLRVSIVNKIGVGAWLKASPKSYFDEFQIAMTRAPDGHWTVTYQGSELGGMEFHAQKAKLSGGINRVVFRGTDGRVLGEMAKPF
ncbi:MAG TPA: hypothetical protein VM598_11205 [Bdellovibrionota bacterium]|nr:hypothetical protein [Bdellovibrionota bacterium]